MKKDQSKRMIEMVRLSEAIKRNEEAAKRTQETLDRLHDKRCGQIAELRCQEILLKWNL